jgi:hypothetical protein
MTAPTLWSSSFAIGFALASSFGLRVFGARWARGARRAARVRVVAAARLSLALFVVIVAVAQLIMSASGLEEPLRWLVWAMGALCALPWASNGIAGLWLLSPFINARLGDVIVGPGQSGRIVGYGVTRLELETESGGHAHLPYVSVVWRPLLESSPGRPHGTEFTLRAPDWTEGKLQHLRQAAVLAPYRDLSSAVSVTRQADVASVRLSLTRPGSETPMRRLLDAALARYDADSEASSAHTVLDK